MHRAHLAAPLLAALLATTVGSTAVAQNKPIFKFSQAYARTRDGHVNSRGNRPQAEKVPPLKRIADPSNLLPIVPPSGPAAAPTTTTVSKASANLQGDPGVPQPEAIKVAAQIKTQEDLKGQKIKGLKYLGTIGCGCYAKKYDIEGAFLEALEDCTEEVRLEAARAILAAACSDVCKAGNGSGVCDKSNCCTKAIVAKLAEMAYKQDKDGCWIEPSERVRNAALRALNACQPYLPPEPGREPGVEPGAEPGGVRPIPPVPPIPPTTSAAGFPTSSRRMVVGPGVSGGSYPMHDIRSWTISDDAIAVASTQAGKSPAAGAIAKNSAKTSSTKTGSTAKASKAAPESSPTSGTVLSVDASQRIVELAIDARRALPQGTKLQVFHRYLSGNTLLTELEVIESTPGRAFARPLDMTKFAKVSRGDEVQTARR